jgi:RNA polymerase subunit RPABC4/transcription elongation factor Spt4
VMPLPEAATYTPIVHPVIGDSAGALVLGVAGLILYLALLWVALAFFVLRDAKRRSNTPSFVWLAGFLGFVPPFLGPLVYLVIRPPRTIEEERTLALEEQALIDPMEELHVARACPSCGRDIDVDFVVCPYCRTQFSRRCAKCDRILRLGWPVCPYCATEVGTQPIARSKESVV